MDGTKPEPSGDLAVARLLVVAQLGLMAGLVLLPGGAAWPVPRWLEVVALVAVVGGLGVMVAGATTLGRGLTALPLPNRHARLRTGGLYRWVRHPIYSGLLLLAAGLTLRSGSLPRLPLFALLVAVLAVKARFEERRLAARFPEYPAYAATTPRFVPRLPRGRSNDRAPE